MAHNIIKQKQKPLKAVEAISKFGTTDVFKIMYPGEGRLEAISTLVGVKDTSVSGLVSLFDGAIKLLDIDLKAFAKTISDKRDIDAAVGITYAQPQLKDATEVHFDFYNNLQATGDVESLIFWIDGKILS